MTAGKTAVLLLNVGSPDKPKLWQVWKYLTQFLNDKRVIDLSWPLRTLLVNLIIIPFRLFRSTQLYKRLWTEKGSPLIIYSQEMAEKLEKLPGVNIKVFPAMRYGNPGYKEAITKIEAGGFNNLFVMPLFPQYAMSTTGTAIEAVNKEIRKRKLDVRLIIKDQFYDHPLFIKAFVAEISKFPPSSYDHIIFSYHGLPCRHLEKCHPGISPADC